MEEYKVEKVEPAVVSDTPAVYEFKYVVDAVNEAGETVKIIDTNRKERITVEQLDEQIASHQAQIDALKAKKTAISALEAPVATK